MTMAEELDAQQPAGVPVARVAHPDPVAIGVVNLVVVRLELDSQRVEAGIARLVVPRPVTRSDHVEDLHYLGPKAPSKLAIASERIFTCHPALLVGGGSSGR